MPKVRYEKKVQNIVEHTNMDRKEVIVPKEVREDTKGKIEKDAEWRKKKQEEAEERKKQRDLN